LLKSVAKPTKCHYGGTDGQQILKVELVPALGSHTAQDMHRAQRGCYARCITKQLRTHLASASEQKTHSQNELYMYILSECGNFCCLLGCELFGSAHPAGERAHGA
jgi:hypothetical protein